MNSRIHELHEADTGRQFPIVATPELEGWFFRETRMSSDQHRVPGGDPHGSPDPAIVGVVDLGDDEVTGFDLHGRRAHGRGHDRDVALKRCIEDARAAKDQLGRIQPSLLDGLCPEISALLEKELEAGNSIVETSAGWPAERSIFVMLEHPFLYHPATLPDGVELHEVNDPHWWNADYTCQPHQHVLACRFS